MNMKLKGKEIYVLLGSHVTAIEDVTQVLFPDSCVSTGHVIIIAYVYLFNIFNILVLCFKITIFTIIYKLQKAFDCVQHNGLTNNSHLMI